MKKPNMKITKDVGVSILIAVGYLVMSGLKTWSDNKRADAKLDAKLNSLLDERLGKN